MTEKIYDQREDAYAAQFTGIQIIRRGQPPEEKKYIVTCANCKSELGFKRTYAQFHNDQGGGSHLSIICPVCKKTVTTGA